MEHSRFRIPRDGSFWGWGPKRFRVSCLGVYGVLEFGVLGLDFRI